MDGVESHGLIPRVNVGITNKLPYLLLGFHCKDKHRDNGFHTLAPYETYHFQFSTTPNIISRTQWFCKFSWDGESHYFDIFIQIRDNCDYCEWIIEKTGPCKYDWESNRVIKCYPWNDKKQHQLQGMKLLLISNTPTPPLALQPLNSRGKD
ncbi:hypothetical protein TanjilG_04119 [Lupinus angustifolius]|uniref:S-protein homolog n=1 Tax=Lupinus angustifolius TaxID=3871 RepID=A0A4P1RJA0_LUPAN|nr:hypothetical protein TanjilG_04119 [Lupinus angustifolius]